MFTVLDPVDANLHYVFNYYCVSSSFFGWSPWQRSDMILVEVSKRAYDMVNYISIYMVILCLWNLCKPDMVPVSIYVEWTLFESESNQWHADSDLVSCWLHAF